MAEHKQKLAKCDNADYQNEIQYIRKNVPSWKDVTSDQITMEKFPFGHSRATFKITASVPNLDPNPILLRKFQAPDAHEGELFQKLGDIGWGPKCYHRENNLRIEQYFPSTVITCREINQPAMRRTLSIKLAQLHKLEGLISSEKKGFLNKVMDGGITMQLCKKNLALDVYDEDELQYVKEMKEAISEPELNFLKDVIAQYPLHFSHNDIWSGNILLLENKEDVVLVDFEMMDYNFPGYDLGKLILETLYERHPDNPSYKFLGFENLPTEEEMKDFVKFYLVGKYGIQTQPGKTSEQLLRTHFAAVQKFYDQVKVGIMLSGWYSMAIGMRLGKNAGFQMDFFQFAKDGLAVYKEF
eukprot:CAMPEP_0168562228 /NCGR_PEP_ID=MMETSP0413-20121227/12012_1 /TAXON_ID=136452 /ORGANISM="Filamoeba nolandi, Strain NC-AS-23-1" /LENGTH=354 /DNA_ID=CAMNT_0008593643 /DNA_START=62 /DNA_END=1123 /DNA_ORIENTATION=+